MLQPLFCFHFANEIYSQKCQYIPLCATGTFSRGGRRQPENVLNNFWLSHWRIFLQINLWLWRCILTYKLNGINKWHVSYLFVNYVFTLKIIYDGYIYLEFSFSLPSPVVTSRVLQCLTLSLKLKHFWCSLQTANILACTVSKSQTSSWLWFLYLMQWTYNGQHSIFILKEGKNRVCSDRRCKLPTELIFNT